MALLNVNTPIAGFDAAACLAAQICDYLWNLEAYGSDKDDRYVKLKALLVGDTRIDFDTPVDFTDVAALNEALDNLGLGEFEAQFTSELGLEIIALGNPYQLKGIYYDYEAAGKELYVKFSSSACQDVVAADGFARCDYTLNRGFENIGGDAIRFQGIEFEGDAYRPETPIDTSDSRAIAAFINEQPQSEGKFFALYRNDILTIGVKSSKYLPVKVLFEIESKDENDQAVLTPSETSFVKTNCVKRCDTPCGSVGQLPCNNGLANGCNDGLVPDRDGRCYEPCVAGTAFIGGQKVAAGGANQVEDCNGNCMEGYVKTAHGCQPADASATICDIDLVLKANPNEKLTLLNMGGLGIFKPLKPILLKDGAAVLEWVKAEIVPEAVHDRVTIVRADTDDDQLKEYRLKFTQVNFNFEGVKNPFEVTSQYCAENHSCVEPQNCEDKTDISRYCTAGNVFDSTWCACLPVSTPNKAADRLTAGDFDYCYGNPNNSQEYEANKASLVEAEVLAIKSNPSRLARVKGWFADRNMAVNYEVFAINALVRAAVLNDTDLMCFEHAEVE